MCVCARTLLGLQQRALCCVRQPENRAAFVRIQSLSPGGAIPAHVIALDAAVSE